MNLSLEDVLDRIPTRSELSRALSLSRLQGPSHEERLVETLATFGAGVLVGSVLALLFTPRSGPELRQQISDRLHDTHEQVAQS